jgi:hypothetical protein
MIIQTILLYPIGAVWTDEASNVSRLDPSGADQIDAEHQATDLAVGIRFPRGSAWSFSWSFPLPWHDRSETHSIDDPTDVSSQEESGLVPAGRARFDS